LGACAAGAAEQDPIIVQAERDDLGFFKPIPITINGFSGEALSVLKNDLTFMGFKFVSTEEARYVVNGSAGERVEGRVVERITSTQRLGKAYTGGSTRMQIHAFADDIARTLTGLPGIALSKIAFKVEPGRGRSEVYISDFDGFNPTAVTQDGSIVSAPCWAGRGALLYGSYKLGNSYIFSHVLGTGERGAVARHPGDNYSPAVSRNGRRVAMILNKKGAPSLYVANIDGSGLKQLTSTRQGDSCPCWSPDNETICYVSRSSGVAALYTISASGGSPKPLRTAGAPNPTEPDWSPDGKWIAFTSLSGGFQIYIVKAGGGDVVGPLAQGEDPTWAPNSRALMISTGRDHRKNLSLLDAPTKTVKPLARILESNSQPSWAK
jgi:TolB protein